MLPPAARRRPGADLTVREVEVLGLAAQGISNAELGRLLFVSERTIKFHLRNVFLKLGATNRTEAAHVALIRGLIG
jgi:DNA-binding CsgD family transcriptional regulator